MSTPDNGTRGIFFLENTNFSALSRKSDEKICGDIANDTRLIGDCSIISKTELTYVR